MNQELISVCIPVYNGEKYLKECLDSVLVQSYKNIEILIVDDGSIDSTFEIAKTYLERDKRIKVIKNEENLGLVNNWNKCIKLANGNWIKFVFQDDILLPECIEKLINASNGHSLVVCERDFIFGNDVPESIKKYYTTDLLTLKKLLSANDITSVSARQISKWASENLSLNFIGEPTSVLFKKVLVQDLGYFNADLTQICDLEFWLRIGTAKGLVYVPEDLVKFRIHTDSTSSGNVGTTVRFRPRYIDTLLLAYELLYNKQYKVFREISNTTYRLQQYLGLKMYEAKLAFEKDLSVDRYFFDELLKKYPSLKKYYNTRFGTKLLFQLVLFRRKLKNQN